MLFTESDLFLSGRVRRGLLKESPGRVSSVLGWRGDSQGSGLLLCRASTLTAALPGGSGAIQQLLLIFHGEAIPVLTWDECYTQHSRACKQCSNPVSSKTRSAWKQIRLVSSERLKKLHWLRNCRTVFTLLLLMGCLQNVFISKIRFPVCECALPCS